MDVLKSLLQELATIGILESELEYSKEIKDKQLEHFMPKNVNSVSYDEERVSGGISSSEEYQVMQFAKSQDEINKLEDIIRLLKIKADRNIESINKILTPKERRIFELRYVGGMQVYDVALEIDLSERQIIRICKDIKVKIKELELNVSNIANFNENVL